MEYIIFDANFFIDLKKFKQRALLNEIAKLMAKYGMRGTTITDIRGEVKNNQMQNRITRLFNIIDSPRIAEDPLFEQLDAYRGRKLTLNPSNARFYPKRPGDPDIQLTWLAAKILQGEIFPEDEEDRKCYIVTDDEGVQLFTEDYFQRQFQRRKLESTEKCKVIKNYWFLHRFMNRPIKSKVLHELKKTERYMFNNHIKEKRKKGRLSDIVTSLLQLREDYSKQVDTVQELFRKSNIDWSQKDQQWLRAYIDPPEDAAPMPKPVTTFKQFLPILDALKALIKSYQHWNLELPVPETFYQIYYQLLLHIHNFKSQMRDAPNENVTRFFFIALVVDAKLFSIFMDVVQLYLRENNVTRAIETMNLLGGHLSSLTTQDLVKFQALLAFLWIVKGEKNIAKNIVEGLAGEMSATTTSIPGQDLYRAVLQLLDFLERDFQSSDELEAYLVSHLNQMAGCSDEPLDSDEFRDLASQLHDLALTQASMGSPLAPKLLLFTTMAKKLSCVPENDFLKAAEKYIQSARTAGIQVQFPDQYPDEILRDHTGSNLLPEKKSTEFVPVESLADGFYLKHFHVNNLLSSKTAYHLVCWFEPLNSRVLLVLPRTPHVEAQMKSPLKIWLLSGRVKTSLQRTLLKHYDVRVILRCADDIRVKTKNRTLQV